MKASNSKKAAELVHSEIAVPEHAPAWVVENFGQAAFEKALAEFRAEAAKDGVPISDEEAARLAWAKLSERLWNSVEDGEDRLNKFPTKAQLARSVTLALPRMLSREAQVALMRGFVSEVYTGRGMIADWVIHETGDGNPHVHVMLTLRDLGETDWGLKNRDWNARSMINQQRKVWADQANLMLEREGFVERIDHRSLKQQELELEPETYNPHIAETAELNGEVPREKLRCAEVRRRNMAYLRAHPEHMLSVVQASRAVFSEEDVCKAFATRLDLSEQQRDGELDRLTGEAMASPDLLPVVAGMPSRAEGAEGRPQLYITLAKARMAQQLARDAKALSESGMAVVAGTGRFGEGFVSMDVIETGEGSIVANMAHVKGRDGNDGRRNAADDGDHQGTGTPTAGNDSRERGGSVAARDGRNGSGASAAARGPKSASGPSAAAVGNAPDQRTEPPFRLGANAVADPIEFGTGSIIVDIAHVQGEEDDNSRWRNRVGGRGDPAGGTPVAGGDGDGRDRAVAGAGSGPGRGAVAASAAARGRKPALGPSAAAVREALSQRAEDLFQSIFGEPVRPGAAEWRARDNAAQTMRMRGPRRGLWHDYSSGEGGDLFDLVAREFCGLSSAKADFPKVLEEAARYCGIATDRTECRPQPVDETVLLARARQAEQAEAREAARRAALVKDIAARAVPVGESAGKGGTPAAAYLAVRGITELPGDTVACLPPVPGVPVPGPEYSARHRQVNLLSL